MTSSLLHDISETELLFRLGKWVSLCKEKKTEVLVEPIPQIKISETEKSMLAKGMEAAKTGAELAGKIATSDAAKAFGRFVPGAEIALNVLKLAAGTGTQKLQYQQIKEITMRYLIILETEASILPHLKEKHARFMAEFEKNCKEAESKKSWF